MHCQKARPIDVRHLPRHVRGHVPGRSLRPAAVRQRVSLVASVGLSAFVSSGGAFASGHVVTSSDHGESDASPPVERFWREAFVEGPGITGDWWGARTELENAGLVFAGSAITEWAGVPQGQGVTDGASFRYLVDLGFELDLAAAAGIEGATAFLDFQIANQTVDGADSGSPSGFSNIGVDHRILQVSELWYDQTFADGGFRIKVGKVDANSEFGFMPTVEGFIASSPGQLTTTFALPTYPDPAFGVNLFATVSDDPTDFWECGFGVYDGSGGADGIRTGGQGPASVYDATLDGTLFLIADGGHRNAHLLGDARTGRFEVGGWWNSGRFDTFAGGTTRGTGGIWVNAEQRWWAPAGVDAADPDDLRGLWTFGQFGWTPDRVSDVGLEWGGGVTLFGTFEGREDDSTGIYLTWTGFSRAPQAGFDGGETLVEAYYAVAISPSCRITPDVQYVANPGADPNLRNAWVGTIRLTVDF